MLPFGNWYWTVFFPDLLSQLKAVFLEGNFALLTKGFWRSLCLLFSDGIWPFALLLPIPAALFFFAGRYAPEEEPHRKRALLIGLLLIPAPWLPFFVLDNPWFSFRCAAFSFFGIALAADALFRLIFRREPSGTVAARAAAACLALLLSLSAVAEIHDYRQTAEDDRQIGGQILETLREDGVWDPGLRIGILNLNPSYLEDSSYTFHEHIHGVTESEWALTGYLTCLSETPSPSVAPLPGVALYRPWNRSGMLPETFDVLYLYDPTEGLRRVEAVPAGTDFWELRDRSGATVGTIRETDGVGILYLP